MKKALLLSLLFFIGLAAFSQKFPVRNLSKTSPALLLAQLSPGGETGQPGVPPAPPTSFRTIEQNIGTTAFDLQTVNALGRRIVDLGDSKVSAIWHYGFEAPGFADRGTGYNYFNGIDWLPAPEERLEPNRSGYPSMTLLADGSEVVVSHNNPTGSLWHLSAYTKAPGETNWTENVLPSNVSGGVVWGKVAAGGADGNTLHVVGVSTPTGPSGGVIYEGVENHPLYWRSTDGGQTWDKSDVIIPGLDSAFYDFVGGEAYSIDARGETVAIAVFELWGDLALFKSEDNGETWTKTIVNDFPLDKYDFTGYTANDIPFDPNAPDSISIFTADGGGNVLVDNDGNAHVFFGRMYVFGPGPGESFVNLSTDGIGYWNEDFATGEIQTIASVQDLDGDSIFTITGYVRYQNTGLTTFPSAGVDADGNLYLVYTALQEEYLQITDTDSINYRHIYLIKSEDGGATWSEPFDLINEETSDPDFLSIYEAAYPSIPSNIGGAIHLVYQQDFNTGLAAAGVVEENYIQYLKLDKQTFGTVDASEVEKAATALVLTPNPAAGDVSVSYDLSQAAEVRLSLVSLLGERLFFSQNMQGAGRHSERIDLAGISPGIYFVRLETEAGAKIERLILQGK